MGVLAWSVVAHFELFKLAVAQPFLNVERQRQVVKGVLLGGVVVNLHVIVDGLLVGQVEVVLHVVRHA